MRIPEETARKFNHTMNRLHGAADKTRSAKKKAMINNTINYLQRFSVAVMADFTSVDKFDALMDSIQWEKI